MISHTHVYYLTVLRHTSRVSLIRFALQPGLDSVILTRTRKNGNLALRRLLSGVWKARDALECSVYPKTHRHVNKHRLYTAMLLVTRSPKDLASVQSVSMVLIRIYTLGSDVHALPLPGAV